MNAIGAAILIVLLSVVLFAPRRWALLGMLAGVLFLTQGQQIQILGLNLFGHRFLELAGFIRVITRRELSFVQLNGIDRAFLLLYVYSTTVFMVRSTDGVTAQIGIMVDAFLCYFAFRGLVLGIENYRWLLRAFVFLLLPYAFLVVSESFTDHNPFTVLGGVEGGGEWMRHGRPRCFGSFRQPDTLGMFAASFLPLYIGLACIIRERKSAVVGVILCLVLVLAANSGGAASAAAIGVLGWGFWGFRTNLRTVRMGIVAMMLLLALVMKSPIWYIFAHASSITGGDGWHRSYLIDVAYNHMSQWWLLGAPLRETVDWFPYLNQVTASADITNYYIALGLMAGLGSICLLIFLLVRCFSYLGLALAAVRSHSQQRSESEFVLWSLGVMLTVHIVDWFGITYFDQMYVIWFMQLAAISTLLEEHVRLRSEIVVQTCAEERIANSSLPKVGAAYYE